jgi:hypothetical protein
MIMPVISMFYGILIMMYYMDNDNTITHIMLVMSIAVIAIAMAGIKGELPGAKIKLIHACKFTKTS